MTTVISREERNRRRAAGMREREEYEGQSIEKQKPWEQEGISRAWWYRKRQRRQESYPQ